MKKIAAIVVALFAFTHHRPGQAQEAEEQEEEEQVEQEQEQEQEQEAPPGDEEEEPTEPEELGVGTGVPPTDTDVALAICGGVHEECREAAGHLSQSCPKVGQDATEACRSSYSIYGYGYPISDPLDNPVHEQWCLEAGEAAKQQCEAEAAAMPAHCDDMWWECMWDLDPSGGHTGSWGMA
jgi:hypothetical protein